MKYTVKRCTCRNSCPYWYVLGPDKALVLFSQKQARAVAELLRAMDEQEAQERAERDDEESIDTLAALHGLTKEDTNHDGTRPMTVAELISVPRNHAMTRSEIEAQFTIRDDVITNPGKFEGEPPWAVAFYDNAEFGEELSSMEDGTGIYASLIEIEPEGREEWPELGKSKYVLIEENDQGFVTATLVQTEADAERVRNEFEQF